MTEIRQWEPIGPNDDENDFVLIHHGVKGMKWGVRKARAGASAVNRAYSNTKIAKKYSNAKAVAQAGKKDVAAADAAHTRAIDRHNKARKQAYTSYRQQGNGRVHAWMKTGHDKKVQNAKISVMRAEQNLHSAKAKSEGDYHTALGKKGASNKQILEARKAMDISRQIEYKKATTVGQKMSIKMLKENSGALSAKHLANPDRATSKMMTTGEKFAKAEHMLTTPMVQVAAEYGVQKYMDRRDQKRVDAAKASLAK